MAQYKASFTFDGVWIVDSIPTEEDPQTGVWLHDTVLRPLADRYPLRIGYTKVDDRNGLFEALANIERVVRGAGLTPIIHFETHGVVEGIALADRSIVPWAELNGSLTAINRACRMNLLTVMSMCHGGHLVSQLQANQPSPVWALVGAALEIYPARLQEAFEAFYTELLPALNARTALEFMNARHRDRAWDLILHTAEIWFCQVWRQYEKELGEKNGLKTREDNVVADIVRRSGYDLRYAIQGRPLAREFLADNERRFDKYRRLFLMLDEFPDNHDRFSLTYQDCISAEPAAEGGC